MLNEFLHKYRSEILDLTEEKTKKIAGVRLESKQLKMGLPLFYEQLIKVFEKKMIIHPPTEMVVTAASHGREFLLLGYTLSHVVHSYGSMCQAITELATMKSANISASEFNILNGCLDIAIASAVSEFQFRSNEANEEREIKHLGFLAHELRNALSGAMIAQEMIRAGLVGVGGSTASVLESNLARMGILIDRSLSEVRMRTYSDLYIQKFNLSELFDQILVTAEIDANKKKQTITCEIDWSIEIEADRQYVLSAVANLIQNAMKFTKSGGQIFLRGSIIDHQVLIEVQDECGGIEAGKIGSIFKPYIQENVNRSGLGLGLTIAQRAVHLNLGTISVKNNMGTGCTFTINLPLKVIPTPKNKISVPGKDSVQPNLRKRT